MPKQTAVPTTAVHDLLACEGCGAALHIPDLEILFGETRDTLYKWSRCGYPHFPKAAKLPNGRLLVRCCDAHIWLAERIR